MISNRPRTVSFSIGQALWKPCSAIWGPPMPYNLAFGSCGRKPDNRRPANKSPDASPATIAMDGTRDSPDAATPPWLADDATGGAVEERAQQADMCGRFRRAGLLLFQRALGLFQR